MSERRLQPGFYYTDHWTTEDQLHFSDFRQVWWDIAGRAMMSHRIRLHKDLYPQVYDWDNLLLAYRRASKGKRGNPAVAAFEYRLEDNLIRLQEELVARTYQPGPDYSFYIHEPKRRLISAAPFKDRVDHHALCNVIELLFERSFISDSYANRVGQGTHRALDCAQQFAQRRTSSATPLWHPPE